MSTKPTSQAIAVIGVGNEFRRDDGVGWVIVARLRERARHHRLPLQAVLCSCDGEPARLLSLWENACDSIVIDAARPDMSGRAGCVRRFTLDGTLPPSEPGTTSSHGLGLATAVELAGVLDRLPQRLIVYAVGGEEFGLGFGLSAAVSAAVEPTARRIEREIRILTGTMTLADRGRAGGRQLSPDHRRPG